MKIVIAGYGFVGREQYRLFPDALIYDPPQGKGLELCDKYDVVFICVPTPSKPDGSCDTSMIEDVLDNIESDLYIIRSTVNPGFTAEVAAMYYRDIVFQPEYVASSSPYPAPLADITKRDFIILGGTKTVVKKARRLYETVYPPTVKILETDSTTAELIKLCENTAIANKVTLCQEFYGICKKFGVDYDTVAEGVFGLDPRFNKWFTRVYPNKRGFSNSDCLPKDLNNLVNSCDQKGYSAEYIKDILKNNERWKNENTI